MQRRFLKKMMCMMLCVVTVCVWIGCKKKGGRDLDLMLQEGRYDDVIELGTEALKSNPDDYGLMIVIGDAYYLKAKKFNSDAGYRYTPEGAALAKKAIDYYMKSKEIHHTMRVDQKIGFAGALMSP